MPSIMDSNLTEEFLFPVSGPDRLESVQLETSSQILTILGRYRLGQKLPSAKCKEGDLKFLAQIYAKVTANEPILMCLPAFPFKSPNTTSKVLGRLPDKAEEFALAHLNGLCAAIGDIYPPGARLMIVSDGLVYNDLLGVPDRDVWAYGEALRSMSARQNCSHIEFCRLKDLAHINVPDELDEMTYVANATNFRYGLLKQFSNPGFDASLRISEDEDTCLTYRGYIKFLETDLRYVYPVGQGRTKSKYKKGIEYIAKQMLNRGDAFARAVRERFADRIRLSIHPSRGKNKVSISLLPTATLFTTPWHCSIAFQLDGTVTTGHRSDFDTNAQLEMVYEDGRPSFYRERSSLVSWAKEKGGITCTPVYPTGWLVRPAEGPDALSIVDVDAAKVRAMSELSSPIILRGFAQTRNHDFFVEKVADFGTPLPSKLGLPLEMKDQGADAREPNNEKDGSEELISRPPRFQLFAAVMARPKETRFSIFSSSSLVFKYLPKHLSLDYLRTLTWMASTPSPSHDETALRGLPLVVDHPSTKVPCIRYHEPWPQSKTKFEATNMTIENTRGVLNSLAICEILDGLVHDRRVAYHHAWERGDVVASDNILAMHMESGFTAGCDRELWRIHFD
ncbi:putative pyoverdine/dityrosine biosynthesis protein [Biscogniauxia marginata]|nr:putative pyoverdine/dityrosine biosynthesis protein [Biscogniauxia marginata]